MNLSLKHSAALAAPISSLGLLYLYYAFIVTPICRDCAPGTLGVIAFLTLPPTLMLLLDCIPMLILPRFGFTKKRYAWLVTVMILVVAPVLFFGMLFSIQATARVLQLIIALIFFVSSVTLACVIRHIRK